MNTGERDVTNYYGSNVLATALSQEHFFEMKFSRIRRDEIARALS